jgi:dihydropteroate synthase
MVNDVTALGDPSLADAVHGAGAGLVLMHSLGGPDHFHERLTYRDVAEEVRAFLEERMRLAESRGIPRERIALDPGIGFSKTADQSLATLRGLSILATLGRPIYLGVSRKSFLATISGSPAADRLGAAVGISVNAYDQGARIYRTHDVRETVEALRAVERIPA